VVFASLGKFALGVFPKGVAHSDKIGHFIIYTGFTIIWIFFFLKVKKKSILKSIYTAFIWSVFFGVFMECCQWMFTSYRQFDYYDMLANTTGSLLGLLIFGIFLYL